MFLRILEYYAGILFLTTNRIGVFDDAFRSRLHLALFYPQLDFEQTKQIWKMNINRVERHSEERVKNGLPAIDIDRKGIKAFAKKTFDAGALAWNGRQIKNAFQSALALAEMEAQKNKIDCPKLTRKQFMLIAQASDQFEQYMVQTHHGKTEDQLAHREHVRFSQKDAFKSRLDGIFSDDDSSESEHTVSVKASKKAKSKSKSKKKATKQGSESSEEGESEPVRKSGSKKKGKKVQQSDSSDEDEKGARKSSRKNRKRETDSSDSDS